MTLNRQTTRAAILVSLVVLLSISSVLVLGSTNFHSLTTDTGAEFEQASITNMTIIDDTVRQGTVQGSTADAPDSNDFTANPSESGVIINPNRDLGGIEVELYISDPDDVRIELNSTGEVLVKNDSVSGSTANIGVNLQAGTDYRVIVNHSQETFNNNPNFPITSDDVDIVSGYNGGEDPDNLWEVDAVSAFVGQVENNSEYINEYVVEDPINASINISEIENVSISAEWQRNNSGTWETVASKTITTAGVHEVDLSGTSDDEWRIKWQGEFVGGSWFDRNAVMTSESIEFENTAPSFNGNASPADGTQTTEEEITFEINITDPDFDSAQGDEVTAELFVDGESKGTDSRTSNGTVSVTTKLTKGGDRVYNWTLTDSYGGTNTSQDRTITVPANLTIREESPEHPIITSATAEVTFYEQSDDDPTIVNRTTSNGEINLAGLPTGTSFVVSIKADGYHNRTVLIDSLFDQKNAFLLDKDEPSVENRFDISDRTGSFPAGETEFIVQKAVNRSLYDGSPSGFSWTNIAGDELGADKAFVTDLKEEDRYRIIVQNDDGDQRVLGAYVAETTGTIEMDIGSVVIDPEGDDIKTWSATKTNSSGTVQVNFNYNDTDENTSKIYLEIFEYNNESNKLLSNTSFENGPYGTFSHTINVPSDQENVTWVVKFHAVRVGDDISGKRILTTQDPVLGGMPLWLKSLISIGTIWIVAGLFSQLNGDVGAVVVAALGGLWWYIGFLPENTGLGVVIVAMITAGVIFVNERRGGGNI